MNLLLSSFISIKVDTVTSRAYKFRLEVTPEQYERLMTLCGTAGFVWNKALSICNENDDLAKLKARKSKQSSLRKPCFKKRNKDQNNRS
ncbi:helix-turn-helix domain-containing protein [Candidatus Sororendozoicomonas aggregata]|uniref:helix-turn-helix domain-containing protein n=1 Tax=Candidatus Sororendozoicomonas aggregata TaxID=3073239 RepID=UPI002ED4EEBD